jgi:hypothetical protein
MLPLDLLVPPTKSSLPVPGIRQVYLIVLMPESNVSFHYLVLLIRPSFILSSA